MMDEDSPQSSKKVTENAKLSIAEQITVYIDEALAILNSGWKAGDGLQGGMDMLNQAGAIVDEMLKLDFTDTAGAGVSISQSQADELRDQIRKIEVENSQSEPETVHPKSSMIDEMVYSPKDQFMTIYFNTPYQKKGYIYQKVSKNLWKEFKGAACVDTFYENKIKGNKAIYYRR